MDHHSDDCEVNLTVMALSFVINIVGQLDTDDAERVWPECVYLISVFFLLFHRPL